MKYTCNSRTVKTRTELSPLGVPKTSVTGEFVEPCKWSVDLTPRNDGEAERLWAEHRKQDHPELVEA